MLTQIRETTEYLEIIFFNHPLLINRDLTSRVYLNIGLPFFTTFNFIFFYWWFICFRLYIWLRLLNSFFPPSLIFIMFFKYTNIYTQEREKMYSFRMLVNRTYRESNREKCIQVYTCCYESAEHEQNRKLPCNHRVLICCSRNARNMSICWLGETP